ncbi:MAG TPA: SPOR domain-containing protein [Candidatus Binatia bacterium]|nr:SPOR domain-containing protein [Candidatus Binatia bacterium]
MSKDFAQRDGGRRQAGPQVPGWLWLVAGVALGAAGAAGYYVTRPLPGAAPALDASADKAKGGKKKITIPPKEPSRFAFYELLPSYEVVVPRESVKPESGAKPEGGAGERYVVQVGSFKDRAEADQQKARLALLGIESRVEKVTIDNQTTWYRVRIGPEKDRARVDAIVSQLEKNGLDGITMRLPPGQ